MSGVKREVEVEGTSINQFITVAVARRLAELRTIRLFEDRASRANPADFERIMAKAGIMAPREGDEIPDDWLDDPASSADIGSGRRPG